MVKIRPNRQPRNWQNQTGFRTYTKSLEGRVKFSVGEISKEDQLRKMRKKQKQRIGQISKIIAKMAFASPEEKMFLAEQLEKREMDSLHAQKRISNLKHQVIRAGVKSAEQAEREKRKEEIAKQVASKVISNDPRAKPGGELAKNYIPKPAPREFKIVRLGSKRVLMAKTTKR